MATQYLQCKRVRDFHTCRDCPRLPLSGADAVSLFLLLWILMVTFHMAGEFPVFMTQYLGSLFVVWV